MTNIFNRIRYTVEAEIHNFMDKKQAKNPIAMLNQYVREAEKKTNQTGELLKRQAELKREMERQYKEAATMLAKREEQLTLANATDEKDLIAFAQSEVFAYSTRKQEIEAGLRQVDADYFMLEQTFETMKHKIADMKVRQLSLMGKENVVHAQQQMNQVMTNVQVPDYEEIDMYIDQLSHKIDAQHTQTTLENRLTQLQK